MLADYHFPGTEDSAKNIIRMRGSSVNVWAVGEPGLDSFNREKLLGREELANNLGLNPNKRWGLMTYHAETRESIDYNLENVVACIEELVKEDIQTLVTYANADFGGKQINECVEEQAKKYPDKIVVIPSLGHYRYLSYLKQVDLVIGNSSSGIVEAPFMNIPVINIGDRQKGRYQCGNVLQCEPNRAAISSAIKATLDSKLVHHDDLNYWGDGHTSERILSILKENISR